MPAPMTPNPKKPFNWARFSKTLSFWILVILIPVAFLTWTGGRETQSPEIDYTAYREQLERGNIKAVTAAHEKDFDALIVPGGFGAAKNLCDFAINGAAMQVQKDFLAFAQSMHKAGKPVGLICIAPAMAAAICGGGVKTTIGDDAGTAAAVNATGAKHCECAVQDICVDRDKKLVTTPAYMLAQSIAEADTGIKKLVAEVLALA